MKRHSQKRRAKVSYGTFFKIKTVSYYENDHNSSIIHQLRKTCGKLGLLAPVFIIESGNGNKMLNRLY